MVLQTRRWLKARIRELEDELKVEKSANELAEKSGLDKCKGIICMACRHAVFMPGVHPTPRVIGCDVHTICGDFKKISIS